MRCGKTCRCKHKDIARARNGILIMVNESGNKPNLEGVLQFATSRQVASEMALELKLLTMEQFIEGCRRERQALIETVATLRAAKKNTSAQNVTSAQINAGLDARIFNCECSIARYELLITEAQAKATVGSL